MNENERFVCSACGIADIFPARAPDGNPLCMDCARGYCNDVGFPLKTMLLATSALSVAAWVCWPICIIILLLWTTCGTLHALIREVLR
jgi:hypothetical protein